MQGKAIAAVMGLGVLGLCGCDGRTPPAVGVAAVQSETAEGQAEGHTEGGIVKVKVFNKGGELVGPVESARVVKTDAEWQKQLTPEQYKIARARAPSRRSAATSSTTRSRASTPASAAGCRCSHPIPSSLRHRLAELLPAGRAGERGRACRPGHGMDPHGDPLRPLRRPPRPRLSTTARRRPACGSASTPNR